MKYLSVLVTLQGLALAKQSVVNLLEGNMVKFGTKYISADFNILSLLLAISLLVTGVGLWNKKRFAYYWTVAIYTFLILFVLISLVYLLIVEGSESPPITLVLIILLYFGLVIFDVQENKEELTEKKDI